VSEAGKAAISSDNQDEQMNRLCLTTVTLTSFSTEKPVALGFQFELEFRNVGF